VLVLSVVEADGLASPTGAPVAFAASVTVAGRRAFDSHVAEGVDGRPIWNSVFLIPESASPTARTARVTIVAARAGAAAAGRGHDEPLGHADLPLDAVHECSSIDVWLDLEASTSGSSAAAAVGRGRVHLAAELRAGLPRDVPVPPFANRASCDVLEVRVVAAAGLGDAAGGAARSSSSSSFVVLSYASERRRTSPAVAGSSNPRWDERFSFRFDAAAPALVAEVWTRRTGVLSSLDFVGAVTLSPASLVESEVYEEWLPIGGGGEGGELLLR